MASCSEIVQPDHTQLVRFQHQHFDYYIIESLARCVVLRIPRRVAQLFHCAHFPILLRLHRWHVYTLKRLFS